MDNEKFITKTVLVCNQKGGVGKTYLSDELCYMCENAGMPFSLRDYDGQGGLNHEPREVENPALIIIDTPGALQQDLNKWIDEADLVIVPTMMTKQCMQPLDRMMEILEPWKRKGKQVLVVLNGWDRFTATSDFEEWFYDTYPDQFAFTLSASEIIKQASEYGKSVVNYKAVSKSASEMMGFYNDVMQILYGKKRI